MLKRIFIVLFILFLVFPVVEITDADAPPEEPEIFTINPAEEVEGSAEPPEVSPDEEGTDIELSTEHPMKEKETEPESLPAQEESQNEENTPVKEPVDSTEQESGEQEEVVIPPIPVSPESESDEPEVETVSRHPFLESPALTVQDGTSGLVLTLTGHSPVGNKIPEKAVVVFQLPDEIIGSIEEKGLSAHYHQATIHSDGSLISESSGTINAKKIWLDSNQVRIQLNAQDSSVSVSDFTFTLRIPLRDNLQTVDWIFYAQSASEPTDLAQLGADMVGYAVWQLEDEPAEPAGATDKETEQVHTNSELTTHSMSTFSATATATQTSRLTFASVPEILEFEDVYIVDEEVTVVRKNPDWSIGINDTRGAGSTWSLMMRATPLKSTVDSTKTIPDALVFIDHSKNVKVIRDQDIEVHKGKTEENPVTHLSWNWNRGPLLRFNPSTVEAGSYSASITWTLVDAP
ncbi:hypothetical protein [Bhargavaea massiliensis]|uniref:hypothetical protein n=1 Tax=Bhargavaea massiliensis TaxID=2697500 RepID=UPI001BCB685C|nr:hypothetical protein [Bhargavaea massiliensis]